MVKNNGFERGLQRGLAVIIDGFVKVQYLHLRAAYRAYRMC